MCKERETEREREREIGGEREIKQKENNVRETSGHTQLMMDL
jgi:hypothetical protein